MTELLESRWDQYATYNYVYERLHRDCSVPRLQNDYPSPLIWNVNSVPPQYLRPTTTTIFSNASEYSRARLRSTGQIKAFIERAGLLEEFLSHSSKIWPLVEKAWIVLQQDTSFQKEIVERKQAESGLFVEIGGAGNLSEVEVASDMGHVLNHVLSVWYPSLKRKGFSGVTGSESKDAYPHLMPTQYSKALKQVLSQIDSVSSDTFIHVAPPDTSIEEESDLPELLKELSEHPAVNQIFLTITTIDSSISKKQAINHAMALSQLLKEKTQIQVAYNKASTEQALSTYISPNS